VHLPDQCVRPFLNVLITALEIHMNSKFAITALCLAGALAAVGGSAQAQDAPLTRQQVQMDRDTFLKLMQWDEHTGQWVLKSNMEPPKGVVSRSDVLAMRDEWLRHHRYDEPSGTWQTVGTPREMSKLTREQVNMETIRFLMMYRFDESRSEWISRLAPVH
jgi:hypothetical protein